MAASCGSSLLTKALRLFHRADKAYIASFKVKGLAKDHSIHCSYRDADRIEATVVYLLFLFIGERKILSQIYIPHASHFGMNGFQRDSDVMSLTECEAKQNSAACK